LRFISDHTTTKSMQRPTAAHAILMMALKSSHPLGKIAVRIWLPSVPAAAIQALLYSIF
jgi:hypothetical protein